MDSLRRVSRFAANRAENSEDVGDFLGFVGFASRLVAQVLSETRFVYLAAPFADDDRGHAVADQVRHGHRLPHEPMDAEHQHHSGQRDGACRGNGSSEHEEREAGDPRRPLGREQENRQDADLPAETERRIGGLRGAP